MKQEDIEHNNMKLEFTKFMVGIKCCTYNHHEYIEAAMNGFTMQHTTFPFVAVIIDDASTDGEPEVISNYLNKYFDLSAASDAQLWENDEARYVFAHHKQNQNCYFGAVFLKTNYFSQKKSKNPHTDQWLNDAKYIALCEGDDYWINPQKLQIQVEFMERHPDYTLCGTNALVLWDYGENEPYYFNKIFESRELMAEDIIGNWALPTASLLYRHIVIEDYPEWSKEIYSGDQTLILISLFRGRIYFFKDTSCIYRRSSLNTTSISNSTDDLYMREQHIKLYTYYNEWSEYKYDNIISRYIENLNNYITKTVTFRRYYSYKEKNWLLPYIKMPIYSLKLLKFWWARKIKNLIQ